MKLSGIYSITHKASNRVYIGQSANLKNRIGCHKRWFENPDRIINRVLYNYAKKYPLEDFEFAIVEECPVEKLDEREVFWCQKHKENTFNSRVDPVTNRGCKRTKEFCVSNKDMLRKHYSSPGVIEKHSEAIKAAMQNPETRRRMSIAAKERKRNPVLQPQIDSVRISNFLRGHSKTIGQYDKGGNLVDFHLNVEEAARSLNKGRGNISSNLTGRVPSAYGFIWKYITNDEYLKLNNGNILKGQVQFF